MDAIAIGITQLKLVIEKNILYKVIGDTSDDYSL